MPSSLPLTIPVAASFNSITATVSGLPQNLHEQNFYNSSTASVPHFIPGAVDDLAHLAAAGLRDSCPDNNPLNCRLIFDPGYKSIVQEVCTEHDVGNSKLN